MSLDRREFLWRAAVLLGGAVSTSCTNAVLGHPPEEPLRTERPTLAADERAILEAAVDRILPTTATPGALEAGVPDFVEFALAEGFGGDARQRFRQGLAGLDAAASAQHGRGFAALPPEDRDGLLAAAEQAELAASPPVPDLFGGLSSEKPFFATLKELSVVGHFTSETGATGAAAFTPWPGRYDGCVTPEPGARRPLSQR